MKTFICLKLHDLNAIAENDKPVLTEVLSLICASTYYSSTFQVQAGCSFETVSFRIFYALFHIHVARMDKKKRAYYCFHTEVILFRARSYLSVWLKCQHSNYIPIISHYISKHLCCEFSQCKGQVLSKNE